MYRKLRAILELIQYSQSILPQTQAWRSRPLWSGLSYQIPITFPPSTRIFYSCWPRTPAISISIPLPSSMQQYILHLSFRRDLCNLGPHPAFPWSDNITNQLIWHLIPQLSHNCFTYDSLSMNTSSVHYG